jgi:hypothetical protein
VCVRPSSVTRSERNFLHHRLTSDTGHGKEKSGRDGANSREKKKSVLRAVLKSEPPAARVPEIYIEAHTHFGARAMKRGELCATPHQVFRWSWSPTSERLFTQRAQ